MKKFIPLLALMISHTPIYPAGSAESETSLRGPDESEKFNVIFYGKLESQAGNTYDIEYITWDHEIKKIEVYEKPKKEMYEVVSPTRNRLKSNPKLGGGHPNGGEFVKKELNLVDVKKIEVPNNDVIWGYLEESKDCCDKNKQSDFAESPRSTLYIELAITDASGKTDNYLALRSRPFTVAQIRRKDSEEIDLPEIVDLP